MDEHGLPIVGTGVDYTKVNQLVYTLNGLLSRIWLQVPALEHKNTLVYLNSFVTQTAQFLNRFSAACEEVCSRGRSFYHSLELFCYVSEAARAQSQDPETGHLTQHTRVKGL